MPKTKRPAKKNTMNKKRKPLYNQPIARRYTGAEKFDITSGVQAINKAGLGSGFAPLIFPLLNGCAQGANTNQRTGREILMTSLTLRVSWTPAATVDPEPLRELSCIRVLCFYDRQAAVTSPDITSIMDSDHYLSFKRLSGQDRYIILVDEYLKPDNGVDIFNQTGTMYRKLNLPVIFGDVGGGAADIVTGAIRLTFATPSAANIQYVSRIRFTNK